MPVYEVCTLWKVIDSTLPVEVSRHLCSLCKVWILTSPLLNLSRMNQVATTMTYYQHFNTSSNPSFWKWICSSDNRQIQVVFGLWISFILTQLMRMALELLINSQDHFSWSWWSQYNIELEVIYMEGKPCYALFTICYIYPFMLVDSHFI